MPKRKLTGIIVSDKMQKTVVVKVEQVKKHSKYHKRLSRHQKYKAQNEKGEFKLGDKVIIEECRPLSKDKQWRVIGRA